MWVESTPGRGLAPSTSRSLRRARRRVSRAARRRPARSLTRAGGARRRRQRDEPAHPDPAAAQPGACVARDAELAGAKRCDWLRERGEPFDAGDPGHAACRSMDGASLASADQREPALREAAAGDAHLARPQRERQPRRRGRRRVPDEAGQAVAAARRARDVLCRATGAAGRRARPAARRPRSRPPRGRRAARPAHAAARSCSPRTTP